MGIFVYDVVNQDGSVAFAVVRDQEDRRTRFYDLTSGQLREVFKAAQTPGVEYGPSMAYSLYSTLFD